jgi:hypothetical protein
MAVTAGELLDAAHLFPFRPLREKLKDQPFSLLRRTRMMRV